MQGHIETENTGGSGVSGNEIDVEGVFKLSEKYGRVTVKAKIRTFSQKQGIMKKKANIKGDPYIENGQQKER